MKCKSCKKNLKTKLILNDLKTLLNGDWVSDVDVSSVHIKEIGLKHVSAMIEDEFSGVSSCDNHFHQTLYFNNSVQ